MRDCDIRKVLKPRLAKRFEKSPSLIVDELGFNSHVARIDVAVINCALHAYEIKSSRDDLSRLARQLDEYADQFNYVTVVCATKHLENVVADTSQSVGVIECIERDNAITLKQVRRPKVYSQPIDRLTRLFWWEEALAVLEKHGLARGCRSKKGSELRRRLESHFTVPQLLEELRLTLRHRREQQLAEKQKPNDGLSQWF